MAPDDPIQRVAGEYVWSGSYLDADDLAQEARLAQWENSDVTTLRYPMLDANRRSIPGGRRGKQLLLALIDPTGDLDPWDRTLPTPDERAIDAEAREALVAALNRLRPRSRYLLVEHYWHGRPLTDIAADYGITVSRASQIHTRALRQLRETLAA